MTQPPPQPNNSTPIVDLLIEELQQRKQLGIQRYGVPLQANNGRDALRDALDEALDLVIYLRQAIEERDKPISIEQEIAISESNFSDIPGTQLRKMKARGAGDILPH